MNRLHVTATILLMILILSTAAALVAYTKSSDPKTSSTYIGVAFGGTTTSQAKLLIDRTKTYNNLFILNAGRNTLSINKTAVTEICDYATNQGLSIIVNLGVRTKDTQPWQLEFFNNSKDRYGDKFLGVYYDDEPMGIPFDWDWQSVFHNGSNAYRDPYLPVLEPIFQRVETANQTGQQPQNYTVEAKWFHELLMRNRGHNDLQANNITTFTSDYLLYWYDFLGNYDTIFAQLGWNTTLIPQQIAQVRGAATLQNKTWGTIITWSTKQPPYLDSADNIYDQMVTSYNAGAKYTVIFDYPYSDVGNPYGILTDEHFAAMEKFWNQIATKEKPTTAHAEAALVLPKDYGWAMRNLNDRIWGIWPADNKTPIVWNNTEKLLSIYGLKLDIVYDDPAYPIQGNYSRIYFWNETIT
jgi:hypothetical protein